MEKNCAFDMCWQSLLDGPRRRCLDLESWIGGEVLRGPDGMSDGHLM